MAANKPNAERTTAYAAAELHRRLLEALSGEAPALIFSGPPGTGKSTVLASVPVPEGRIRRAFDHENSMKALDAKPDGVDIYTKRHQRFRMTRTRFPKLEDYAQLYEELKSGKHNIGAVLIDNIKLLQDQMAGAILMLAATPDKLKPFLERFDAARTLPHSKIILGWQRDGGDLSRFWETVKQPFANLVLACQRENVIFLGSTEEGNVWSNYGTSGARVVGKKAKLLDVWLRYTDSVIFLARDPNVAGPPKGSINLHQPKMRIQGLNPTWVMDWPGFIAELETAAKRRDEEIPATVQVSTEALSDEPEPALPKQTT